VIIILGWRFDSGLYFSSQIKPFRKSKDQAQAFFKYLKTKPSQVKHLQFSNCSSQIKAKYLNLQIKPNQAKLGTK